MNEAQLASGFESIENKVLNTSQIDTPLGPMVTMADEKALYMLEFNDCRALELEVQRLRQRIKCAIIPGKTAPMTSIEHELALYFSGKLTRFKTPLFLMGTPFQKQVWHELQKIPYGETLSYLDLAKKVGNPKACRAVAQANGSNQHAIIIPCHRVINHNGDLGGYAGTVARKEWLLKHEKNFKS